MYNRFIGIVLALGAVVFVLLLAGVGSAMLTDDPPEVSPYASDATTTTATSGAARFVLSTVAFGDAGYVEITNVGTGAGTLDGHWLCQFPSYGQISGSLGPGESARFDGAAGGFGDVLAAGGEIGLYTSSGFGDPGAIIAYVEWGKPGHERSGTATDAGVWTADSAVDAAGATLIVAVSDVPTSAEGWATG
jgi:hypothetical protein